MTDKILNLYKKIGFNFYKERTIPTYKRPNLSKEYKYHPDYLDNSHYTLIVFISNNCLSRGKIVESIDYRLYIHNDFDGSYIDSLYQTSDESIVIKITNETFKSEIRNLKLENIFI